VAKHRYKRPARKRFQISVSRACAERLYAAADERDTSVAHVVELACLDADGVVRDVKDVADEEHW
jgi:hypothetical protein